MINATGRICAQFCSFLYVIVPAVPISLASGQEQKSPTIGEWSGFSPGDYVIEKRTYHGVGSLKDGVGYRKTVLLGATKYGAASFFCIAAKSRWILVSGIIHSGTSCRRRLRMARAAEGGS